MGSPWQPALTGLTQTSREGSGSPSNRLQLSDVDHAPRSSPPAGGISPGPIRYDVWGPLSTPTSASYSSLGPWQSDTDLPSGQYTCPPSLGTLAFPRWSTWEWSGTPNSALNDGRVAS